MQTHTNGSQMKAHKHKHTHTTEHTFEHKQVCTHKHRLSVKCMAQVCIWVTRNTQTGTKTYVYSIYSIQISVQGICIYNLCMCGYSVSIPYDQVIKQVGQLACTQNTPSLSPSVSLSCTHAHMHTHRHVLIQCPAGLVLRELLDYTSGFNGQTQAVSQSAPGWTWSDNHNLCQTGFCWITMANNAMTPMMSMCVSHPQFKPCRCYLITAEWAVCVYCVDCNTHTQSDAEAHRL